MTTARTARAEERRLEGLSPFELKNELIALADATASHGAAAMVNAGRGNPNWTATAPREAFFLLGEFAVKEARRDWNEWPILAGMPPAAGSAERLAAFLDADPERPGAAALRRVVDYGTGRLGLDPDALVGELTDGIVGDHYPTPDRILPGVEKAVHEYLVRELCGGREPRRPFDLFATEGGTAAMCYVFDSLLVNGLLRRGDRVAIMTPVFTPYLEIPRLDRFAFDVVELKADRMDDNGFHTWQYPDSEIDKLADPKVKALFCVNPSNPPSVMLAPRTLDRVASIVGESNPNLAVITDDVYGTFVDGFRSFMAAIPRNVIGVYSFSKYFGCTGWRLGVVAVNQDNVFDERIAALGEDDAAALSKRYSSITLEPAKLAFVDRMVADSRDVALNHTAGLSLPQQVQMALFALSSLADEAGEYRRVCAEIIDRRMRALVAGLGVDLPADPLSAHYYVELDLLSWAERHWGAEFAAWMRDTYEPVDPIFRLAREESIVLLNGGGFDGPEWSVRISLANLPQDSYRRIGEKLWQIGQEYLREFERR